MLFGKLSPRQHSVTLQKLYSKRNVWYGTLCWSWPYLTLSHSCLWSPAFNSNYKGEGVGLWRHLLLVGPICISLLIFFYVNRKRERARKGEGRGGSLDSLWSMGNPMPEVTLKGQQREMVFCLNPSHIVYIEWIKKKFRFVLLFTEIWEVLTH